MAPSRQAWMPAARLGVLAAVALVFWPALAGHLVSDDFMWCALVRFGRLTLQNFAFATYGVDSVRPLIHGYFLLAYHLFGSSPFPWHFVNLCLHLVNTALVMVLARRLLGSEGAALLAGLLFGWAASASEAVIWISAVTSTLSTTLFLVCVWAFCKAGAGEGRGWAAAALVFFSGALLAKEETLPLIAVLGLIAWWQGRGTGAVSGHWRSVVRRLMPETVVVVLYALLQGAHRLQTMMHAPMPTGFGPHVPWNLLVYGAKLLLGVPLLHPLLNPRDASAYLPGGLPAWVAGAAPALALCAMAAAGLLFALALWKGAPVTRILVLWVAAVLILPSLMVSRDASRYAYLATVPFSMLAAGALCAWWRGAGGRRWAAAALAIALLLDHAAFTLITVRYFNSRGAVMEAVLSQLQALHPLFPRGSTILLDRIPEERLPSIPKMFSDAVTLRYEDDSLQVFTPPSMPPTPAALANPNLFRFYWTGERFEELEGNQESGEKPAP